MRARTGVAGAVVAGVILIAGVGAAMAGADESVRVEQVKISGVAEAGAPVSLDATVYLPAGSAAAPAVMLAHGFGGSKTDLADQARTLARSGYVVLAWTQRGFGLSGGLIHLNAPDYEVADARKVLDYLAGHPRVIKDAPGDPRVGVAGGSYGGALALSLAGRDQRVDAIAPQITWNDLQQSLFPQFAVDDPDPVSPAGVAPISTAGVFKRSWAGVFFGSGGARAGELGAGLGAAASGSGTSGSGPSGSGAAGVATATGSGPCGRFAPDVCAAYESAATTGRPSAALVGLLARSSPKQVASKIKAPTLLLQGEADSLFPLSQADANAAAIAAAGTPVKVVWHSGGHDGGVSEADRLDRLTQAWFDRYLARDGSAPDQRFELTVPSATISSADSNPAAQIRVAPGEPGVTSSQAVGSERVTLSGTSQTIVSPAGGSPAAVSTVPGLGSLLTRAAGGTVSALPGQAAVFDSAPLRQGMKIVGGATVALSIGSTTPDATVFVSLQDVPPSGEPTLPQGLVSPVRIEGLTPTRAGAAGASAGAPGAPREVIVRLPAIVHDVVPGHRLRVVVSATDQAYFLPADRRQYTVALAGSATGSSGSAGPAVVIPVVTTTVLDGGGPRALLPWASALAAGLLLLAGWALWARRRTRNAVPDPELVDVPLDIKDLGKAYGDGYRAVSDLSFRVERGWVLGLLGPNGAGKTTTLRMLMGLISPTEGAIRVFGQQIGPGAPVLSRVGVFIEGPGFLPHVNGLENLRLYWQATGRPLAEAHLDDALEVAGLGEDVYRQVKTYSQGMRQRLAIAQAMLGLPDLLVMDEPTNGLDPPQIREMREVLSRYAATGRTVVVSSHLLSEVEQTCTHVVVMNRGRLVAQGEVGDLVGSATSLVVDVDDPVRAAEVAAGVPGASEIEVVPAGLVLSLAGTARGPLVRALVDAGLQVERIAPRRGLEEAFLALVGEA